MFTLRLVLVACLGAACATAVDDRTASDHDTPAAIEIETADGELVAMEEEPSICGALPSTGLCSHLCDPEGFDAHIPPGVCAAILCTLTDGRTITVHGCHH
jgi:hypothetical protein